MTLKSLSVIAALAAAAIAAQAQAAPTAPAAQNRDCFYGRNLTGFRAVDNDTVLLGVGVNQIYEAKLFAPSNDLRWVNGVALISRSGGNFVCSKLDADLVVPNATGVGPQRFPLASLRHLSPQEVAAIPRNERP